jgi:hypothetical protein
VTGSQAFHDTTVPPTAYSGPPIGLDNAYSLFDPAWNGKRGVTGEKALGFGPGLAWHHGSRPAARPSMELNI